MLDDYFLLTDREDCAEKDRNRIFLCAERVIKKFNKKFITYIIIYKEMFLGCDWLIRVQLIPSITQNSAKICNNSAKICFTRRKTKNMAAEFSRLLEDFVEISTQFGILL